MRGQTPVLIYPDYFTYVFVVFFTATTRESSDSERISGVIANHQLFLTVFTELKEK
jgi:hypothetical protein